MSRTAASATTPAARAGTVRFCRVTASLLVARRRSRSSLAVGAAAARGVPQRNRRDLDRGITPSRSPARVHARVILPAGYATAARYPVVYFLHGLPPRPRRAYQGTTGCSTRCKQAGPAILVIPQGARDTDTDPEYLDWGVGRNWMTYVSDRSAELRRRPLPHDRQPQRSARSSGSRPAATARRDRAQPPRPLLGDRVVVGLLPPHRPDRDAGSRPRTARERAHASSRPLHATSRADRRSSRSTSAGRHAVPRRERALRPRIDGRARSAPFRALPRRAHDSALATARRGLALARAPASRPPVVTRP